CGRPAVVLARSAGVDTYRRALAAGARAVLPLPAVPAALGDALVEAAVTPGQSPSPPGGRVTAIIGAKGGTGATSIALAHVGDGLAAAVASAAVHHPCGLRLVPGPAGPEIAAALPGGFAAALVRDL